METARSAPTVGALTMVQTVAVLLELDGSVWLAGTMAVLQIGPDTVGVTTMVTVVLAPLPSAPGWQVTVPLILVQSVEADLKFTTAGSAATKVTAGAEVGPALWRVIVYVK